MDLFEILLIAVGLSADAFAVSVCKGLALRRAGAKECFICAAWFGVFQGLMPLIGYFLGTTFAKIINNVAPWITFVILLIIGGNMIREALSKEEESETAKLDIKTMFFMAVATSIDAFATGVTFGLVSINIASSLSKTVNVFIACGLIAVTTFILSWIGVKIGCKFGSKYKSGAELVGGTILTFIGLKVLMEYLGLVDFMDNSDVTFGLLLPFAASVFGSAFVFIRTSKLSHNMQRLLTGFAAGIMVSVLIWCLLYPAETLSTELSIPPALPLVVGFWIGIIFQLLLDHFVPHIHNFSEVPEGPSVDIKKTTRLALAAAIHHASEGIAVGVILAGYFLGNTGIGTVGALAVVIGMAIQNIPEAAVESIPLKAEGEDSGTSFFMSVLSGAVEPILGILTLIIACALPVTLPYIMAYSAAAMLYVVVEELIPEMTGGDHPDRYVIAFAVGFSLMMTIVFILRL